jgi:hypothetical protein
MCTVLGDTLRLVDSTSCRGSPMARKRKNARPYLAYSLPALRVSQPVIASPRLEAERRRALALQKLESLRAMYLAQIEDARRFHPDPRSRSPRDRKSRIAKISVMSLLGSNQFFSDPFAGSLPVMSGRASASPTSPQRSARSNLASRNVIVCVRRKSRREVLFAAGAAGGRVSRRRRRNSFSNIIC